MHEWILEYKSGPAVRNNWTSNISELRDMIPISCMVVLFSVVLLSSRARLSMCVVVGFVCVFGFRAVIVRSECFGGV